MATAAPRAAGCVRPPSPLPAKRLRCRGPRSYEARQRRYKSFLRLRSGPSVFPTASSLFNSSSEPCQTCILQDDGFSRPVGANGEPLAFPTAIPYIPQRGVEILSINIGNILHNQAELCERLRVLNPDIVLLQETRLDESVPELLLPGYHCVSRADRLRGAKAGYGGIIAFERDGLSIAVHLEISVEAERSWLALHTDVGPLLVGNWYRPPDGLATEVSSLAAELEKLCDDYVGVILCGDMNIHHERWLRHSNANTALGELLYDVSTDFGLRQRVDEPTGYEYLLDLVLSDLGALVSTKVLPAITDHRIVCIKVLVPKPERKVWRFRRANWRGLRGALSAIDWGMLFTGDVRVDATVLAEQIREQALRYIPTSTISVKKTKHPWLSERCVRAIDAKHAAEGSDGYAELRRKCSETLASEFKNYTAKLRSEISSLPWGSKKWWSLNRELLNRQGAFNNLPSLKNTDGEWVISNVGKAELLAERFAKKCRPSPACDGAMPAPAAYSRMHNFVFIRRRWAHRLLRAVDPEKSTGPDLSPGRILRECAAAFALSVTLLCRRIMVTDSWPWNYHWLHPLFKGEGTPSDPDRYRGLHLTPILSKVVERLIGIPLCNYLDVTNAYGDSQSAFRPRCSCRTLLTVFVQFGYFSCQKGAKL